MTEWSFPALDTGRPCLYGAGQRFRTQAERTRATALCARTMLSLKCLVGYDYFMWVDQPAAGMSDPFPEDSNYGLISEEGVPYDGLVSMFARLHKNVAAWRLAAPPAVKETLQARGPTGREFLARYPKGDVTFERHNDRFTVRNGAGLEISASVGSRRMLDAVRLNGRSAGVFTAIAAEGPSAAHLPSGVKNAYSVRREWRPAGMRSAPFFCGTASGYFARNAAFVIAAG